MEDLKRAISKVSDEKGGYIELENLSKIYHTGDSVIRALDGVNLSINAGDFVVIMGPSGSGKTTMVNLMGGLEQPSGGTVRVDGEDLKKMTDDQRCDIRRHHIGFIFQFFNLHPKLTALENVELPMLIAGAPKQERVALAKKLLEMVELAERADHFPHELSGGQKQRVGIARALANDPDIILADEPTGDMDSTTGEKIMALLWLLNKKHHKTCVIVSHDESHIRPDVRLVRLKDGTIESDELL